MILEFASGHRLFETKLLLNYADSGHYTSLLRLWKFILLDRVTCDQAAPLGGIAHLVLIFVLYIIGHTAYLGPESCC